MNDTAYKKKFSNSSSVQVRSNI